MTRKIFTSFITGPHIAIDLANIDWHWGSELICEVIFTQRSANGRLHMVYYQVQACSLQGKSVRESVEFPGLGRDFEANNA